MNGFYAHLARLRPTIQSKAFRYALGWIYFINLAAFCELLTADCLGWQHSVPARLHWLAAAALALTSYLAWMLYMFLGIGYLTLRSANQTRQRNWINMVRCIGYPLLYGVYTVWGFVSLNGPAPWLGRLALGACAVFYSAYFLARWAGRNPRPSAEGR